MKEYKQGNTNFNYKGNIKLLNNIKYGVISDRKYTTYELSIIDKFKIDDTYIIDITNNKVLYSLLINNLKNVIVCVEEINVYNKYILDIVLKNNGLIIHTNLKNIHNLILRAENLLVIKCDYKSLLMNLIDQFVNLNKEVIVLQGKNNYHFYGNNLLIEEGANVLYLGGKHE